jgi:NADH-quinone oxidoreductase subunit C
MADEGKTEPPAEGEQEEAQPTRRVALPGGASSQRPALPEKAAEAKSTTREPPPPGTIADLFAQALPDTELQASQGLTDIIIEVKRDDITKVMETAKDDPRLDLKFLRCLFGVDHQEDGLEVVYQLLSYEKGHEVVVKTRLPSDDPRVASVTPIWKAANWHERETRDMFGITFDGHPHLVPLLLPEDMTDHFPLRKDNPLAEIEEWQGELLGEGAGEGEEETEEE